jgi:RNA polymerase sigma factor (sigma-70 family)
MTPGTVPGVITISAMPEEFADLYAAHLSAARRAARALVPAHAADDIVAEAFARVLAARLAGGGPAGEFRPYLLATVRNLAHDYGTRQRRASPVPLDPRAVAVPGAGELAARREEMAVVARAFGSLRTRWRAVLWATEVEGLPAARIAAVSGMTPNAVAALALRARAGLARAWECERGQQERDTAAPRALQPRREISS